ncbi:MAG: hypothetical protein K1X83_14305 [Oligoflexia bacterium]|nr:hypothetical protein [Oligoflexia bacterium]
MGSKKAKSLKVEHPDLGERGDVAPLNHEIAQIVFEDLSEQFEEILSQALDANEALLVQGVLEKLEEANFAEKVVTGSPEITTEWVGIESLSALRAMVGGRFHSLKTRWVEAGLPLKEHRGDKVTLGELDKSGWIELTSWISKQGFEVRLCPDRPGSLFELRSAKRQE